MALSPAQLQRLRKAAQKTYQGSTQSAEVLNRIGEEEGVPVITRLGGLATAVGGLAETGAGITAILSSGGAAALLGGGIAVVDGIQNTVEGLDTLMGKVDALETGQTQIIEQTAEGGSSECQFKAAARTQLDEVHGDLTNIGGGITGTGDAARAAAGYLGSFLISNTPEASNHPNIKATAHQILQQAQGANTQAGEGKSQIIDHRQDFEAFNDGLDDRIVSAVDDALVLLRRLLSDFGHYTLDTAGWNEYQTDLTGGKISGDGPLVSRQDEDGEWVPVLNPDYLTFERPDGERHSTMAVLVDVINTLSIYPRG